MGKLLHAEQTGKIIGAAMQDHRVMGPGYLEAVYQECLTREFRARALPFVEKPRMLIRYQGEALTKVYIPDFLVFECIVLEIKAATTLLDVHASQVLNALRASNARIGLLMNFGESSLKWRRFVHTPRP
ncbi:MAG: GxxExxY protein [Planctomycetes bacterium]|nr:GxxExxY protein [Planctomycetota bacterium]